MSKGPSVSEQAFYNRTAEKLAKRLPGELLVTEAGRYVISMTEGFNGLIRKGMKLDHARVEEREPGTWSVTNFRGNPQLKATIPLNIVRKF